MPVNYGKMGDTHPLNLAGEAHLLMVCIRMPEVAPCTFEAVYFNLKSIFYYFEPRKRKLHPCEKVSPVSPSTAMFFLALKPPRTEVTPKAVASVKHPPPLTQGDFCRMIGQPGCVKLTWAPVLSSGLGSARNNTVFKTFPSAKLRWRHKRNEALWKRSRSDFYVKPGYSI